MKIALLLLFVAVVWAVPVPKNCQNLRYTPFSVRKEVCGSDGKTYSNIDHLHYESCTQNKDITYVRDGYCDPEEGKRAQEAHRKFMADYAKQIRQALKEGRPPPYIADAPMPNLDDYPEEK